MEDHDVREPDIHNFSTSSSHRLPTISGVEALQNASIRARGIPTNLLALDSILLSNKLPFATSGIQRGHVTEIFGPPGVGKTTFGLQIALNAMHDRQDESQVLWVNTGPPLVEDRLDEMLATYTSPSSHEPPSSPLGLPGRLGTDLILDVKFNYLEATSLPRLLTLFLHPTQDFPPRETCLIIVDDLSNLLLGSFSRNPKKIKSAAPAEVRAKLAKRAAGKRFQIIENLAAAMSKLAALRQLAVVVLTNATTNLKSGQKGVLKPALASQAWDTAIHTRIMLYHDFAPKGLEPDADDPELTGLRYAEVQKLARQDVYTQPVPFLVTNSGIHEINLSTTVNGNGCDQHEIEGISEMPPDPDLPPLPLEVQLPERPTKRKIDEIADSEEEDNSEDGEANDQELSQSDAATDEGEPKLPVMPRRGDIVLETADDEMILDTHEASLLRSYRYAAIKGSEDAEPVPSSDVEDEIGDSDDDGVNNGRPP